MPPATVKTLPAENPLEKPNRSGNSPLLDAVGWGFVEEVVELLEKGADIESTGAGGLTALLRAAKYGRDKVLLMLLDSGASLGARGSEGETVLMLAAKSISVKVFRLLLDSCPQNLVKSCDNQGRTALHYAIASRKVLISDILVLSGLNPYQRDHAGATPESIARTSAARRQKIHSLWLQYERSALNGEIAEPQCTSIRRL